MSSLRTTSFPSFKPDKNCDASNLFNSSLFSIFSKQFKNKSNFSPLFKYFIIKTYFSKNL